MNAWTACSCLALQIERFVELRRLSGSDYHSQARLLAYFDRFLVEQNVKEPRVTRQICELYLESLAKLAPRTQGNRFGVVRQLCEYLARTDPLGYIPEPLRRPSSCRAHSPYIFTPREVAALMSAAMRFPPSGTLRPHTYRTLFGLLYSTGIRIGEAFALNLENFFPLDRRLYIAEGKFHKARWIALSSSTVDAVEEYVDRRIRKEPHNPDSPLLLNEQRRRLCHPTVHAAFRVLLSDCNIVASHGRRPRIHDLRHTFAVHRLLQWYRDGEDVNSRLPILATYMGHVNVGSTRVYLQPTAELLGEVDRRFRRHYLRHLAPQGGLS
jgi:site-specific recombinase XerD